MNLAAVDDSRETTAERTREVPANEKDDDKVRLDKRLWAAHFFKIQALTRAVIEGGKVHCRGERCKPSKEPRVGEELTIRTGSDERTVTIRVLSIIRRGAPEAQALYEETAGSVESRERAAAMCKAGALGVQTEERPNKKQWRQVHQLHGGRD